MLSVLRSQAPRIRTMLTPSALLLLKGVHRVVNAHNKADFYCSGHGLEVGALSCPFRFTNAKMRYADVMDEVQMRGVLSAIPIENLYHEQLVKPDIIIRPPKYDLPSIEDSTLDFVYSSHSLEHSPNPIFALSEYSRVIRQGGCIYTIIPNKDETYDRKRATTPVTILIDKYRNGIFEYTLEEARDVAENTVDHPLYVGRGPEYAAELLAENSGIHHFHTFDIVNSAEIIKFSEAEFGLKLQYLCAEGLNIHFCLRKT
ncbi:methyltransferase domain-containing protein [Terrihabitans sp. B22-R8]|uniref:methyltransferase domain-containing protein n=1 Tax=Terrihabitans sp. B22-R8 TaxID=3425128 RepID=UPI00403D4110